MTGCENYTPTQRRMLAVLADGMPHAPADLLACLWDSQATIENVRSHLSLLRKKLRPRGQDVVAQTIHRRTYYRHVRLLTSPDS